MASSRGASAVEVDAGGVPVRVSSPDKAYFPELGLSKLDVVRYVLAVGEGLLAALRRRPTTMERWTGGVTSEARLLVRGGQVGGGQRGGDGSPQKADAFYQKQAPRGLPDFVDTATVTYPSGRTAVQVTPTNLATLAWMANLGTLRFHPWPVTAPQTELVDQVRIDLDPQPGTDIGDAVVAASELRTVLRDAGLQGWVKTSGGRGLHVFVPVAPVDFIDARHATIAIARELARRMPEQVSVDWWKEQRGQRIFVDFNQMARDRLMTSAYSIRPVPTAQVSAPLSWDELRSVDPAAFTVVSMPARFREGGDRWADLYTAEPGSLATALQWWQRDLAAGEGELPYPPDYPKMPGEPPRVQPSRARTPEPGSRDRRAAATAHDHGSHSGAAPGTEE